MDKIMGGLKSFALSALFRSQVDHCPPKGGGDELDGAHLLPGSKPLLSQVARHVFRGHASETIVDPRFEPFVVAVHVLDVEVCGLRLGRDEDARRDPKHLPHFQERLVRIHAGLS